MSPITDHDSIEGALRIRKYPNVFLSKEVTCRMPSGTTIHSGAYDLTERQHIAIPIRRQRNDPVFLLMYLTERQIFFSVKHIFPALPDGQPAKISTG